MCSVVESDADDPSWRPSQQTDTEAGSESAQMKNPLACHICGRVFKKSNHLTQHVRSHYGLFITALTPVSIVGEMVAKCLRHRTCV